MAAPDPVSEYIAPIFTVPAGAAVGAAVGAVVGAGAGALVGAAGAAVGFAGTAVGAGVGVGVAQAASATRIVNSPIIPMSRLVVLIVVASLQMLSVIVIARSGFCDEAISTLWFGDCFGKQRLAMTFEFYRSFLNSMRPVMSLFFFLTLEFFTLAMKISVVVNTFAAIM